MKRKSKATQLKEDYNTLKDFYLNRSNIIVFNIGQSIEQEIKSNNPTAYWAVKLLNDDVMESCKYNVKKVDTAIILKQNTLAEVKLAKLLNQQFKPACRYTNAEIKQKLQTIYNQLNIRNGNGTIKVAKATDLRDNSWFEIESCKKKTAGGEYENAQLVIRAQFNLLMAA